MITEQFKLLCRAYWPDCYFAEEYGYTYCYPDTMCRLRFCPGWKNIIGYLGKDADVFVHGKPKEVIKKVYNDVRSRDDNRTV